ncbi:MAG: type II toxin-antitoxin system VapC family toxin [Candidatus Eremiobacterota bacterium]
MRLLLDTHALLWWMFEPEKLSGQATRWLLDPDNDLLWSAASTWEMAIKSRTGKLRLPPDLPAFVARVMREQGFVPLAVEHSHSSHVATLPDYHRDPFDRLLVAQAILEGVAILSIDEALDPYGIERIW